MTEEAKAKTDTLTPTESGELERSQVGIMRRGVRLVLLGLVVQLFTGLFWSPISFVLFASLGVGLSGLGSALYLLGVWRVLRKKGAV